MSIFDFSTFSADHLTDLLSSEDALEQVLAISGLQCRLKAIKEQVEELLCILLLRYDCRIAIEFFEGEAEAEGVVIHSLAELQVSEQPLHLMEHVIVDHLVFVLD